MAGMGNFRYNIEWGAAVGATLYEVFHHEYSNSSACNAIFFSQHCHIIGVEKRDSQTHMKCRFVHGTVVTGCHVAPLHTIIFHEIDYCLLSFVKIVQVFLMKIYFHIALIAYLLQRYKITPPICKFFKKKIIKETPRDRNGSFESQTVKKRETILAGADQIRL